MELDEILNKLLGDIAPLCETNVDFERYNNINNYFIAVNYLVEELIESAKWKNDQNWSANKIGDACYGILKELETKINFELSYIDKENQK